MSVGAVCLSVCLAFPHSPFPSLPFPATSPGGGGGFCLGREGRKERKLECVPTASTLPFGGTILPIRWPGCRLPGRAPAPRAALWPHLWGALGLLGSPGQSGGSAGPAWRGCYMSCAHAFLLFLLKLMNDTLTTESRTASPKFHVPKPFPLLVPCVPTVPVFQSLNQCRHVVASSSPHFVPISFVVPMSSNVLGVH